jgi:hypothetical protein
VSVPVPSWISTRPVTRGLERPLASAALRFEELLERVEQPLEKIILGVTVDGQEILEVVQGEEVRHGATGGLAVGVACG